MQSVLVSRSRQKSVERVFGLNWRIAIAIGILVFAPLANATLQSVSSQGQIYHYTLDEFSSSEEDHSYRAGASPTRDYQLKYFHFSDGMQIAVAEFSPPHFRRVSKTPLLMGPGYLAPMTYLFPLARALSEAGHPVIVVEPPGQGRKEFASTGSQDGFSYTMEGMASLYLPDIVREISRAYGSPISLIGHSRFGHILRLLIALDGLEINPETAAYAEQITDAQKGRIFDSINHIFYLLSPLSIANPTFRSLVLDSPKIMSFANQLERLEDASMSRIPFGLGEMLRPLQRHLYLRGGLALFENQPAFQLLMGENWDRTLLRKTMVDSGGSAKPNKFAVEEMESLVDSSQKNKATARWNSIGSFAGAPFSILERYIRNKARLPVDLWAISAELDESYDVFLRELRDSKKILELTGAAHAGPLFDPTGDMKTIVDFISAQTQLTRVPRGSCSQNLAQ